MKNQQEISAILLEMDLNLGFLRHDTFRYDADNFELKLHYKVT